MAKDRKNMKNQIIQGDTLTELKKLPSNFVDTIITSPPYWSLRDYGVKGQIGLEKTLDEYTEKLLAITEQLKRVLKKSGVMFWNMGDCYGGIKAGKTDKKVADYVKDSQKDLKKYAPSFTKCMMLQNYRLIIEMVNQGWILRNTIIWHKPNHMPSSVKDRFTNSYEPVFMLVKSKEKTNDIKFWLPQPIEKHWASWLAAIIDGEGTIGIRKCKREKIADAYAPYLTVTNSCKEIVEKCLNLIGLGTIKEAGCQTNLKMWRWEIGHNRVISVLGEIYPYLIEKREQAKVVIALQKLNKYGKSLESDIEEKERLFQLIKKLNQRQIKESGFPEPNLNKTGGCEKYWFDLDAVRKKYTSPIDRWGGEKVKAYKGKFDGFKEESDRYNSPRARTQRKPQGTSFEGRERDLRPNKTGKNPGDVWNTKSLEDRMEDTKDKNKKRSPAYNVKKLLSETRLGMKPQFTYDGMKDDLWRIPTQPFSEAHFATFPQKLVEPMIKATCPKEICKKCGKARVRIIKGNQDKQPSDYRRDGRGIMGRKENQHGGLSGYKKTDFQTLGWTDCNCKAGFEAGIVLDPFLGSGTVAVMARKLRRNWLGIELSPEYIKIAKNRLRQKILI